MKKILLFACLCLFVLCTPARADGLHIASCEPNAPFLTVGQLAMWTVDAVGGDGAYSFTYTLMRETDAQSDCAFVSSVSDTGEKRCAFFIDAPGRYLLQVDLFDETGAHIRHLSQPVETAPEDSFAIEASRCGATVVYTEEELTSAIDGAIRDKAHYLELVDSTNGMEMYVAAAEYLQTLVANGAITSFSDLCQNGTGICLYFNYQYEAASPAPIAMSFTQNAVSLSVGESAQTGVAFYPSMVFDFVSEGMESGGRRWKPAHTLGVEWSSESERIATVDQTGTVTGIRPGTARIEARCGALLCAFDAMVMGPVTEIREGIQRIEDEAFMGCDSFTRVVLPESLLSVGSRAFANCAALREVVFQNDDVNIADDAFSGATDLTFVCGDANGNVAQYALQRGFRVRQE